MEKERNERMRGEREGEGKKGVKKLGKDDTVFLRDKLMITETKIRAVKNQF